MTPYNLNVAQREIVWLEFPFSDLSDSKTRPGLIVSNNSYNQIIRMLFAARSPAKSVTIIVLELTTQILRLENVLQKKAGLDMIGFLKWIKN